ncbi:DNA/RNA nuclease SfsA [Alteromonas lipotrueiana]|uniref:DNA/RNA nuclease SfsA n=1 Tax=Alteromonas lipotrueiana TaxID=2803815 RepID=UPI001C48B2A9|nr:DNA/RNA nuclease SfsA [Alteromonas lipotrueiana]|tara:strand:- start:407 stop:1108 length:702 start_codon:yes stop_codon:yes gene_type:complete
MEFTTSLLRGKLIRRYKRFLADIELPDGETVIAHCPNTGAMTGCAEPGFTVYLSESDNPKRKLRYTWELAQDFDGNFIGINTHMANKLVAEALNNKTLTQFNQVEAVKREVTPPGSKSRFDFQLSMANELHYMEVKSVTLARNRIGYFPDAVTARGTRHCKELSELVQQGIPATLAFCVQHTGIHEVRIAQDIDPLYALAVKEARQHGVKVVAFGCLINQQKLEINQTLPVNL